MKIRKGFTLIELLVVIAIIGLLSTLAVVALNNARLKARDAKRIADIKQLQTALELYATENNGLYPYGTDGAGVDVATNVETATNNELGRDITCLDNAGFGTASGGTACSGTVVFMGLIPTDPSTTAAGDPCDGGTNNNGCNPYYLVSTDRKTFAIETYLEGVVGSLSAGSNCASPSGIKSAACTAP